MNSSLSLGIAEQTARFGIRDTYAVVTVVDEDEFRIPTDETEFSVWCATIQRIPIVIVPIRVAGVMVQQHVVNKRVNVQDF